MNREERLRAALAGTGLEDRAADLATLPTGQVDLIVSALKASGRAASRRRRSEIGILAVLVSLLTRLIRASGLASWGPVRCPGMGHRAAGTGRMSLSRSARLT